MSLATFALARSALEQRWRLQLQAAPAPLPQAVVSPAERQRRRIRRFARPQTR
jgi:hypothetical protein